MRRHRRSPPTRIPRLAPLATVAGALALMPAGAHAAGNAQVVNDTAVEAPGTCHVETWLSVARHGDGLANLDVGCTPAAISWLELDLAAQRTWSGGQRDTTLTPGFKSRLGSLAGGVTIALTGTVTMGLSDGHAETVGISVPVTFQVDPSLQINLNAGWEWNRDGVAHRGVFGAQVMWAASPTLTLTAEGFGCSDGIAGYQAGVRWTPVPWFDVDLLAGELLNLTGVAVTLGLTARM